jgi:TolB-like protein/DNA-binding winged helix-turn-helix (wHTH) protein/Flp pilus assembly protein TadD
MPHRVLIEREAFGFAPRKIARPSQFFAGRAGMSSHDCSSLDQFPINRQKVRAERVTRIAAGLDGSSWVLQNGVKLGRTWVSTMGQPAPAPHRVQFGDFEADLRAGELYRLDSKIKIQQLPFKLLSILLDHPGEVVTREELRRKLWAADTFLDFDHSLAVAVSKLREALGDSAEEPRFVETVGRRGYRFLVAIDSPKAATFANRRLQVVPKPAMLEDKPARNVRLLLLPPAVFLLLAVAWFFVRSARRHEDGSATLHISSIAVLPLKNLSNDPGQEYFAEGMTDEIITDLARLPGLRVISHTSSMHYRDTHKMMPEIGRELNVDAVLEGTLVRSGDRVRIRTQLIYVPSDQHVWAQAYERDIKDVLGLQAALAQDIAHEVRVRLTSQERTQLAAVRKVNTEAYDLYLKGRYFWNKRNKEALAKAVDYFQQAIRIDPNYAVAYAGLADAYGLSGNDLLPTDEAMSSAKAAAEKALELDGDLAEAHASLGLIAYHFDWDWDAARQHFERAITLNPNYATAHHWYAEAYLMPMGRVDEAIVEIRKARELDPLSPAIATDLGKELFFARRHDEAIAELRGVLELDPEFVAAHNWLSDAYLEKGKFRSAKAELEKTRPFREEGIYIRQTAYLYARMGRRLEAKKELARSLRLSQGKPVSSGAVALTYAAMGDRDQAFSWLERAEAERSSFMTSIKYWPVLDPLRSDPRFSALLHRVGLSR